MLQERQYGETILPSTISTILSSAHADNATRRGLLHTPHLDDMCQRVVTRPTNDGGFSLFQPEVHIRLS